MDLGNGLNKAQQTDVSDQSEPVVCPLRYQTMEYTADFVGTVER